MTFKLAKALLIASTLLAASSHASVARLTFNGVPGDYISQGRMIDNLYSSADPLLDYSSARFNPTGTRAAPATDFLYFSNSMDTRDSKYTNLSFSSQMLGVSLTQGMTYIDAERASFATKGHPGLDVSYNHRGCNRVRGSFTVNQLAFKGGALDIFGVSFSQSCDGGALMDGTFYYNASLTALPVNNVPEPGSLALLGLGIAGLGIARSRKKAK